MIYAPLMLISLELLRWWRIFTHASGTLWTFGVAHMHEYCADADIIRLTNATVTTANGNHLNWMSGELASIYIYCDIVVIALCASHRVQYGSTTEQHLQLNTYYVSCCFFFLHTFRPLPRIMIVMMWNKLGHQQNKYMYKVLRARRVCVLFKCLHHCNIYL